MKLLRRNPLSCQELAQLVTDYVEGALSARDRRRFERHIADCPMCTEHLAQMRQTIERLGELPEEEIPQEAADELLAAFRDWNSGR